MKSQTTFERVIQNPKRKKSFEKKYNEFLLSELVTELMELENISVRELAKITKLSPTSIQELKSGKKDNPTFLSLLKIVEALGGAIVFKKGNKELVHVP